MKDEDKTKEPLINEWVVLRQRIVELEAPGTERKQAEARLAKINECFLGFGTDSIENINRLTALCGKLLGATCALYNRLDQGMLCSTGQWNTPPDYNPVDKPDGHICYDVIRRGGSEVLVVRNLPQTPYAQTDPNVVSYQLQAYVGQAVKCGGVYIGSLCVVFQRDFVPSEEDKKLMGIIASAIGVEEERERAEEELRIYRTRLEELVKDRTAALTATNEHLQREITERKRAEEQVLRQSVVLEAINKVLRETLTCETAEEVARTCLAVAEEMTESKFGWIGEVNPAGRLDTIALSDPGWETCRMPRSDAVVMIKDMEIRGIWGRVLKDERSRIVNDPASDPDRVGTPEGHPPLTAFLGVPLKHAGRTIGMIGLANKESGYDLADQQVVETLAVAFVEALSRKRAEKALAESEEKYRSLVSNIKSGIFRSTPEPKGRFLEVNPAMEEITGYSKEELLRIDVSDLYVHPEEREAVLEKIASEGEKATRELRLTKKDGTEITVSDTKVPVRDNTGKILYFDGIMEDITERKRLEEEREKIQQQAFQTSRLASIGELAAGVAHEINNPLTGVIGFSELLLEQDLDPKVKSDLEKILRSGRRAERVVQDLLMFSRGQHAEAGTFDLNEAIEDTVKLVRRQFELDNIQVVEDFDVLPQWYGDRGHLQEVFLNLLQNAHDAILSTSLKAGLTRKKGSLVKISTRMEGDRIVLRVQDDGPGMSDEIREKVFDPFFTTKDPGKGTGLGLSIVHRIVVEHEGWIRVESREGEGACFTIELPLRTPAEAQRSRGAGETPLPPCPLAPSRKGGRAEVLVVDDEESIVAFVSEVLRRSGYSVDAVRDGETALERMEEKAYDAILLDIRMPGMRGDEVYEEIKGRWPDLCPRILFITGDVGTPEISDFFRRTGNSCLAKPFGRMELLDAVRRSLEGQRGRGAKT